MVINMFSVIHSASINGMDAMMVHVEVDIAHGLPGFMMVGCLSSQVRESGERVRVALKNSGIFMSPMRITVNLSPADVRKEGTVYDLPVAVGILQSLGHINEESTVGTMILGELSLNGTVNPVRGVLPLVRKAKQEGYRRCLVPFSNKEEGAVIGGIEVIGVGSLADTLRYLKGECIDGYVTDGLGDQIPAKPPEAGSQPPKLCMDFAEINGHHAAKRAAEIAAAGFHHMLLIGPPGSGKTMIAKRIAGILPPLTEEESLEVSAVYSIAGLLHNGQALIKERPFVDPHHTVTAPALAGGGRCPRPGMVSLAHKGVLFLDEMAEFNQNTLDMLRQPLEEKQIHIARLGGSCIYPADFMLIGALNPCLCGYYPDKARCICTGAAIRKYQSRISGPILDRIDICAEVPGTLIEDLTGVKENETSSQIRERVMQAREIQKIRYAEKEYRINAALPARDIETTCALGEKEQKLMERVFRTMQLSARGYYRILRVARTIADLEGSDRIREEHLAESVSYRMGGEKFWEK